MGQTWYAKRGDREVGPVAQATLEKWAGVGRLRPSDYVRQQNETDWRPASEAVQFESQPSTSVNGHPDAKCSPGDDSPTATPFGEWYKERWLSKLRWYFQIPLWLIYGFVWIPIWYVATATPLGGIKKRWASLSFAGKAVACLPLILLTPFIGSFITLSNSGVDASSRNGQSKWSIPFFQNTDDDQESPHYSWSELCRVGLPERSADYFCSALSDSGDLAVCIDAEAFIYRIPAGELKSTLKSTEGDIRHVAISPDGEIVALAALSSTTIWKVSTQELIATLDGHKEENISLECYPHFSSNGHSFFTSAVGTQNYPPSTEPQVVEWDTTSWSKKAVLSGRHPLCFSTDGTFLAMDGVEPGTVVVRDIVKGQVTKTLKVSPPSKHHCTAICFSSDGTQLWALNEGTLTRWDYPDGQFIESLPVRIGGGRQVVKLAPNGLFLATIGGRRISSESQLKLHDFETAQTVLLHHDAIQDAGLLISNETVGCLVADGSFCLWSKKDSNSGQLKFEVPEITAIGHGKSSGKVGPNGQPILLGGDGLNSDWFYEYYLDESGEEILHGLSRSVVYHGDGQGKGRSESQYKAGILISRRTWNAAQEVTETLNRREDGKYLWEETTQLMDSVEVHYRSIAKFVSGDGKEKIEAVGGTETSLFVNNRKVDRSPEYVKGFVSGIEVALQHKRNIEDAKRHGDRHYLAARQLIQKDAPALVAGYRSDASELMAVGTNADRLIGIADGLSIGYASYGISSR